MEEQLAIWAGDACVKSKIAIARNYRYSARDEKNMFNKLESPFRRCAVFVKRTYSSCDINL